MIATSPPQYCHTRSRSRISSSSRRRISSSSSSSNSQSSGESAAAVDAESNVTYLKNMVLRFMCAEVRSDDS